MAQTPSQQRRPSAARFGYLGPSGTFTETALLQVQDAREAERVPFASVDAALHAVRSGEVTQAMVPIENSVEGGVSSTLDALAVGDPLVVVREALVPVRFVLAAAPGTTLADVRRVSTHPHAQAQCRHWLAEHLPAADYVPGLSTAAAAAGLAPPGGGSRTPPAPAPATAPATDQVGYDAALCAPIAAERYGLVVLATDVADNPDAVTRFVLVSRPAPPPPPTASDKTSVVVFQSDDHAGGLLALLEQFSTRGINLTRIESRPTGTTLGRYSFSIDCEGHIAEARVADALAGLHRACTEVRYLGSYPRANGEPLHVTPTTTDRAFADSRAWVQRLRDGRS